MNHRSFSRRALTYAVLALAFGLGDGCSEPTSISPGESLTAKGSETKSTTGPAVSSVDPTFGHQGETNKKVRVVGSGFDTSSQVEFTLDGVANADQVRTNSTLFVSSTELEADITISPNATLDLYDVVVTSVGGKKGIGTEMFEVTTATSIGTLGGNTAGEGVNSVGEVVGFSGGDAFYWSAPTAMRSLGPGHAWDIDEAGKLIAGNSGGYAAIWVRNGVGWSAAVSLERTPSTVGGTVRTVASDSVSGEAILLGGHDGEKRRGGTWKKPILWKKSATGWSRSPLAIPAEFGDVEAWVTSVSPSGYAAGTLVTSSTGWRAIFWDADGTPAIVGPADSRAPGMNRAGTIIVGAVAGQAAYWQRERRADGSFGPWNATVFLPGNCQLAKDVDDFGRIVASHCRSPSRTTSAVFTPPYIAPLYLTGLGDRDDSGTVNAIGKSGSLIAGSAPTPKVTLGAIWRVFAIAE